MTCNRRDVMNIMGNMDVHLLVMIFLSSMVLYGHRNHKAY